MPGIQDFIQSAASQIGAGEAATESATGAILQVFQDKADSGDFQQLLDKVPGAGALLSKVSSGGGAEPEGGGGMLGGLMGGAASGLGGSLGAGAGILSLLQKSGLGSDKLGALLPLLLNFLKSEAGEALVGRIVGKVPELKALMG
jgi:hypothetical protein